MEILYDNHKEEWERCLNDKKRKKTAQTWLKSGTLDRFRHERMLKGINPLINGENSWLTIGDGRYGTDAHYIIQKGDKVHATDISTKLLEIGSEIGFIDSFSEENAEHLSFKDEYFDYVLIKEAFHHFPRPWIALYEAFRVCKKGVILIEPNDKYSNYGFKKRIFKKFELLIKFILRRKFYYGDYNFEEVGNFIFNTNQRELEKFLLGMHYRNIAFKSISDFYIKGCENISLDSKKLKDQYKIMLYKVMVNLQELLAILNFKNNNLLCTILFKEEPNPITIKKLKSFNWKINKLPKNPYI